MRAMPGDGAAARKGAPGGGWAHPAIASNAIAAAAANPRRKSTRAIIGFPEPRAPPSPRRHGRDDLAPGDRRLRLLGWIEPERVGVAVVSAADLAAALHDIAERHDLGVDLRAGHEIDELGLVAVIDIALDRDLVPAGRQIAVEGGAGGRGADDRTVDADIRL